MMNIPSTHQTVMPYLILKNAEAFFDFVQNVFDAKEISRHYDDKKRLMHGEVEIGGCTIMFGASSEDWSSQPAGLFIYVENADASYEKALAHGAVKVMEPETKGYGRTCGVTDAFGNTWWITSL